MSDAHGVSISVVVALHDEESNVERLFDDLKSQSDCLNEIIFVCDHCSDTTYTIAKRLEENNRNLLRVVENSGEKGKKHAQRLGVTMAKNEYIAVTDADCRISPEWAKTIASSFEQSNADIIIAPVAMYPNDTRLSQKLMELEFVSLQMVTASTAILGRPTMCNGANMAFRRDVFISHDSKSEYISGDDMFLLQSVKRNGGKIQYLKSEEALVYTSCPSDCLSYIRQRTRWLRKSTGYKDSDVSHLGLLVMLGNVSWPLAVIFSVCGVMAPMVAIAVFLIKTLSEICLINSSYRMWQTRTSIGYAFLLAMVYPFVLVSIAFATVFRSKRTW